MADVPRIAMFGGTFNPVHIGHLRAAIELREQLQLDQVHMIVNREPPHRQVPGVSGQDRFAMLSAAVEPLKGVVADARELEREGPSYTVDTLRSLREQYGEPARLMMVVGVDAFLGLASWRAPDTLFALAHIVVIQRPGAELILSDDVASLVEGRKADSIEHMMAQPAGSYLPLRLPTPIELSATAIRARLAEGHSTRYLLAPEVQHVIEQRGLYRNV